MSHKTTSPRLQARWPVQILMVKLFLLLQYETSALYSFSPYAWSTYYMQGYFRDFIEIKMRDSCCKAGTKQNPTGLSHFPKYKTKKFMIRTSALQTQHLMHVLELLYSYHNCHQREKKNCVMPDCSHARSSSLRLKKHWVYGQHDSKNWPQENEMDMIAHNSLYLC